MQVDQGPSHKNRYTETNKKDRGEEFEHMGRGENFMNRTPMAYALRSTVNKWDLIKWRSFCKAKDMVNRSKWQSTDWEKIFTNHPSSRRLISNIYNEIKKIDYREPNNPVKNGGQP